MSIDYDRLQKILERVTPGPWTVEDDGYDIIVGNEEGHSLGWGGDQVRFNFEAGDLTHDPALVALAPDIARELLRLHDGIEIQRDICAQAAKSCRIFDNPAARAVESNFEAVANALTILLNGDTK